MITLANAFKVKQPNRIKKVMIILLLLIIGLFFFRQSVVRIFTDTYDVGIGIVSTDPVERIFVPSDKFRETVVHVDEDRREILTLQRQGNYLAMRTISFEGPTSNKSVVSWFILRYCGGDDFAFSSDRRLVAYYKENDKSIYLYDINDSTESLLWKNITSSSSNIKAIKWISDRDVITMVCMDNEGGKKKMPLLDLTYHVGKCLRFIKQTSCRVLTMRFQKPTGTWHFWTEAWCMEI